MSVTSPCREAARNGRSHVRGGRIAADTQGPNASAVGLVTPFEIVRSTFVLPGA